jgi:glycosyltransferase involved in cell wall biosynthesis
MSETTQLTSLEQQLLDPSHVGDIAMRDALLSDASAPVATAEAQTDTIDLGLLSAQEYAQRRSDTLLNNPEAVLDEATEIAKYFDRQDPNHVEQIKQMANLEDPMKPTTRMVVTIPAYNEGSRIKRTLEQYLNQDIDPNLYEIVILDNHPENVADDITASEVEAFKQEHPEISVILAQKVWSENEPATVGNARKYAFDIAQARIISRSSSVEDTILVSNDADIVSISPNYLANILMNFNNNKKVDALVTGRSLIPEAFAKPNLAAAVLLWDQLDRTIANDEVGPPENRIPEPASLAGCSTAVRAAIYAAVGGFNAEATLAEDTELGWMISDARDWNADRIVQFDQVSLSTDPRRFLDAIVNRVPISEMFTNFQQKPEIRQMNNEGVLDLIPNTFDWEQFQDDADSFWQSQDAGMYKRLGKRFEPLFESAMNKLGVEYDIVGSRLILKSVDGLLENLAGPVGNIDVVHSEPRVLGIEAVKDIKQFLSGIPEGVLGAWSAKADRIATQIQSAQDKREVEKLPGLLNAYKHYAGHEYSANRVI